MAKRRILITGGYGFIGSHVVRHFVQKYHNYKIYNLDSITYAGNISNLNDIYREKNGNDLSVYTNNPIKH